MVKGKGLKKMWMSICFHFDLDLFSISNLDFFLILLSRLIAKKEYFGVTLTFIFLKMNENFTRNFLLNRKSQINKGSGINNEWLQIFLKYS